MDTGDVNDTKALYQMAKQIQQNISQKKFDLLADKGYHSGRELKSCEEAQIKTYVSPKESSSPKSGSHYPMEQFVYDKKGDQYRCPGGANLKTNGSVL